jgi:hypothetical protein
VVAWVNWYVEFLGVIDLSGQHLQAVVQNASLCGMFAFDSRKLGGCHGDAFLPQQLFEVSCLSFDCVVLSGCFQKG